MGRETAIAWTHHTFNPWWGCTRIDTACLHCYAETFDKRIGGAHWGPNAPRRLFGDKHWNEPLKWNRDAAKAGVRRKVFCASMCDWADVDAPAGLVERLFALIRATPNLDWLLLTKRADRIAQLLPADWGTGYPNVWLGATVGDQAGLWRAAHLLRIPAVVRYLSMEPLIENVDLGDALETVCCRDADLAPPSGCDGPGCMGTQIDWVIVGGESGAKCRPMDLAWARNLRDQTRRAGAAFFFKQIGGNPCKFDLMEDFPEDLRVREFPTPERTTP